MRTGLLLFFLVCFNLMVFGQNCVPVKLYLVDNKIRQPVEPITVRIMTVDENLKTIKDTTVEAFSDYYRCLPKGKYKLGAGVSGYLLEDYAYFEVNTQKDTIHLNLQMIKVIACGHPIPQINFETKECILTDTAKHKLNALIKTMVDHPTIKVEFAGNTDSKGSSLKNKKVSKCYANVVKNYLVENGIAADRIVTKAYGEKYLLNRCENGVKCTEEEHRENRRVDFRVIGY